MEPFFVADTIGVNVLDGLATSVHFYGIVYTDVPFTFTEGDQYGNEILIFTNSENNCYVSFYYVGYQQQFIVPAKSYYLIIDTSDRLRYIMEGLYYLVRRGSNELPNVRIFFKQTKESIFLKNINIREYVF